MARTLNAGPVDRFGIGPAAANASGIEPSGDLPTTLRLR